MTDAIASESYTRQSGRFLPAGVQRVLGDLRGRVDGDVLAIAYALDGTVLTVEEGGILRRWDPSTGNLMQSELLSEVETCWAFSADGRWIASGSNGVSIWDASSAEMVARHDDPTWMTTLSFSPDATTLASGHDDRKVRIWDSQSGKLRHVLSGHGDEISALAFSADGARLATAAEDRTVCLWDVRSGDLIGKLEGHTDRVDDLAWSPKGNRLASAGWDTSVRVWDPNSGELLAMLNGQGECVHAVRFTPDARWIVCADSDGFVRVWDYERLKAAGELRAHASPAKRLAIRPDGKQVASGGTDRIVHFLSIPSARPIAQDAGPRSAVVGAAWAAGGRLAVVHREGTLSVWSPERGECLGRSLADEIVVSVAGDRNGVVLAGTLGGRLALFDDPTTPPRRQWQAHDSAARLVALRPDGREAASSMSSDGTVRIWDPRTGAPTLIIPEATHGGSIEALAYHPTLPVVIAAGVQYASNADSEGAIALWNTREVRLERTFPIGATAIAVSEDGRFLAAVNLDDAVVVLDLAEGRIVRTISIADAATNALAFDPRSTFLVAAGDDAGMRVWDVATWRMRTSFDVDTRVRTLLFTPDGSRLVSGNANSACYVLDVDRMLAS